MIKILRGRERLKLKKDNKFDTVFSNSWRHSIRSLDKKFNYKDLRYWESKGEGESLSDNESEISYSDGY